jgi:hypothetical protein
MTELEEWLHAQFDEKRVEPNFGLGEAISYLLKRWDKLTLFLRVPNAPLENNICERALKMAIRHRNNSLFYRTLRGARVHAHLPEGHEFSAGAAGTIFLSLDLQTSGRYMVSSITSAIGGSHVESVAC